MEKIELNFSAFGLIDWISRPKYKVVLTMDNQGKRAVLKIDEDSYCKKTAGI